MKKYLSLLMAGALAVSMLGGCGSAFEDGSSTAAATGESSPSQTQGGGTGETSGAAAGNSSGAAAGNVIHIPEKDEFRTVDCQKDTEFYVVPLNIYDRLVECEVVDGVATIVPSLAESWDISADGLVYTFHLRDDVTFHNGAQFTADDVVFTVERMMDPATSAMNTDFFSMIKGANDMLEGQAEGVEGVKALDDFTVEITLEVPFAPFLANLATQM